MTFIAIVAGLISAALMSVIVDAVLGERAGARHRRGWVPGLVVGVLIFAWVQTIAEQQRSWPDSGVSRASTASTAVVTLDNHTPRVFSVAPGQPASIDLNVAGASRMRVDLYAPGPLKNPIQAGADSAVGRNGGGRPGVALADPLLELQVGGHDHDDHPSVPRPRTSTPFWNVCAASAVASPARHARSSSRAFPVASVPAPSTPISVSSVPLPGPP